MSNLSMFMKDNVEKIGVIDVVISKRFKDEEGNIIPWKIKPISNIEIEKIKNECFKKPTAKELQSGKMNFEFNQDLYLAKMITKCVEFPNLNDAQLQDSYGVMCSEDLVREMLLAGEYEDLGKEVQKINGYKAFQDEVEEAKN